MSKHLTALVVLAMLLAACAPVSAPPAPTAALPTAAPAGPTTAPANSTATPKSPQSPVATPAPSGPAVQLQFWHGQSQSQQDALNKLIDQFNTSHPDIHVMATYQGTYTDLYKKVTAAVAAGSPPDLAIAYQNDVANYINAGAIIPLDDLMSDPQIGFTAADMKDIFPAFIDRYPAYGNKVYSIAFMRSMEVMYYNTDMLKAAGFDQPPATWDDFMKICAAVSKPPDQYCYEMNTDASRFSNWIWSRGGDLLNSDGKTVAFDSPAGVATMQFISDMFTKQYAIVIGKAFQDQTDFSLGKIAFTFGSSAGLPFYKQAIDQAGKVKNWGIAPNPHSTADPVVDLYGPSVTIFKTTPEKERAAFVFLKWMMGTGPNADWVKATYYFPARQSTKEALADFITANSLYGNAYGWLQYGRTEPTLAAWNPIRGFIADAMTAVANGKAAPEAAIKDAAQKANAAIAGQ